MISLSNCRDVSVLVLRVLSSTTVLLLAVIALFPAAAGAAEGYDRPTFTYDNSTVTAIGGTIGVGAVHDPSASPVRLSAESDAATAAPLRRTFVFVAPRSTGIQQINGRNPINSSYAGRVYDGPRWTSDLAAKYPDGVRFSDAGFPDFSPYSRARVQFDDLTGVYATDAAAANRALNLSGTPSGHVWHHVEDGSTMILIPQDIHNAVRHTGGAAVIRGGG